MINRSNYRESRYRRRRKQKMIRNIILALAGVITVGAVGSGIYFIGKKLKQDPSPSASATVGSSAPSASEPLPETTPSSEEDAIAAVLAKAGEQANGYDYDGAITTLTSYGNQDNQQILDAVADYEATKLTLKKVNIKEVTHIFFHSLVIDNAKAFDGDIREAGYNQVMTTKDEFLKMMEEMYNRGFVLVKISDLAREETDENGKKVFVPGEIMLPEGKQAFVMSQDDVCYYEYMEGDGFATKMIIGEDGKPTCEMKMEDGTISVGDYDLVPILETFIQEHPGFSYRGARAILAFTGYNGILGYRTADSFKESPTYQQDREEATKVAQNLRDNGWELASHSWGHRNMGQIPFSDFKADTDKWENQVESLIGPTDIILFPFGSDIGSWTPYADDNERFQYLKSMGFRYFCNVDSNRYWVQLGEDHLRQGRRNLDGYRMYYDMIDPETDKLGDLFNVDEIFDSARPKPVLPMS